MDGEAYARGWQPEDAALRAARSRAGELGIGAVPPLAGAALRLLAALSGARAAVEVGTGAGVSTLWLVRGLRPGGVLTTIDAEGEHQRVARQLLAEAEVASARVRLITGRGEDVVPRLSEAAYDLVHLDAGLPVAVDLLPEALRVLRPGGVLVVADALAGGRIGQEAARDPDAVAARALAKAVGEDPGLTPLLLPVEGTGLLVAARSGLA